MPCLLLPVPKPVASWEEIAVAAVGVTLVGVGIALLLGSGKTWDANVGRYRLPNGPFA